MQLLLQLVRKMTSAAHDGGMDKWLRDYSIRHVKFTMIVEFTDESSTKPDLAMCEEREPTVRWRNTWETKGFRPAVCWRHIAIN